MSLIDEIRQQAAEEYRSHAARHPDEASVGERVLLYGQDDLEERNNTYEVPTYLPGWFTIGDDGGGTAILMRLDGSPGVYLCGHGAIGSLDPEPVADSFASWLAADCPLPDDDEFDEDEFDDD